MMRASQGHSVVVDLQLAPREPPDLLYHGTVAVNLPAIRVEGCGGWTGTTSISRRRRMARAVGGRRGRPVVLEVSAGAMNRAGYVFYLADNGVWLTDRVPPAFITESPWRSLAMGTGGRRRR
jgi:putative RNA 2'-phosphotransferase